MSNNKYDNEIVADFMDYISTRLSTLELYFYSKDIRH